jgi:hypothetical protein
MGLLLIAALWAFLRKRFWVSAAFLAIATMQSEAFILVFVGWTLLLYFLKEKRSAWVFAAASGASLLAMVLISHVLLGKASIRDISFTVNPALIWRTFIEPETGVWLFIPWSVAVFCFLLLSVFSHKTNAQKATNGADPTRVLRVLAAGVFPVAAVYMILPYTGQFCYGPRYWVPFVPWLALGLILGLTGYKGRQYYWGIRLAVLILVGLSAIISVTSVVMPPSQVWHQQPLRALEALLHSSI